MTIEMIFGHYNLLTIVDGTNYVQKFITPHINAINLVGLALGISFCHFLYWKTFRQISFSALERNIIQYTKSNESEFI